ncbi:MAG TPA: heme-binding beta-barrel domain-containing protein [Acidimicrobiales bacterium]|nr:heme-binding beta-barrel domain-containing protein [Acidimicrobiales bacterium]
MTATDDTATAPATELLGPLAPLVGEWEGDEGVDTAFAHDQGGVIDTPYRERLSLTPFGPVANGRQVLYGLDYRTAMWKAGDPIPFHTEVGYWLWDAATGEVLRGFVVPRGIAVLAGGTATADATTLTMRAAAGDPRYAIGENAYLADHAASLSFEITITIGSTGWSYDQVTMLRMSNLPDLLPHADRNSLRRVGS